MEPAIYFTTFVFMVCALQLIWNVRSCVRKWLAADKHSRVSATSESAQRDDWYMFFYRSQLMEKKKTKMRKTDSKNRTEHRGKTTSRRVQKRRQSQTLL